MNWLIVARLLGLLCLLVGGSMCFSLPWAFPACGQVDTLEVAGIRGLLGAIVCSMVIGASLYFCGRGNKATILRKEAMAIVGLGWILIGVLGALPFIFAGVQRGPGVAMTPVDAVFESISGLTTTGASVLTELEDPQLLPRCVLFWRCFTHWLGGMGIIVLFVAVLGHLGASGKAMLKREVPGPITESVRPRVQESALIMWLIYVILSFLETMILCGAGVSLFDALCHSFGTLATGGFSTFNRSAGHFNGGVVEVTIIVFMVLAGTNFTLYYLLFRKHGYHMGWRQRVFHVFRDAEFLAYLSIIAGATVLIATSLLLNRVYDDVALTFRHSLFSVVSVITTTGFGTEDFDSWSEFAKGALMILMFVGGSAGSTGGGIKVIRWVIAMKMMRGEIERSFRPNVVRPLRIGGSVISDEVRHDVLVYFCLITFVFVAGSLALITIEPDTQWEHSESTLDDKLLDCASAVAATLNNIGPGIGVVGPARNYSDFSAPSKVLLTLLMLLGRLELFAILVLFSPRFWRSQ